jgi:hypothetical protein
VLSSKQGKTFGKEQKKKKIIIKEKKDRNPNKRSHLKA